MRANMTNPKTEIDIKGFKKELRETLAERYGSIGAFLKSDDAKKIGLGYSDRLYLYDSCAVSIKKLNKISEFLGGKVVKRETSIVKTVKYYV